MQFSRTALLIGEAGVERLKKARVAVFGIVTAIPKFQRELKHVNLRLSQARSNREYQYYLRRRRRLWVSFLIPFIKYKK